MHLVFLGTGASNGVLAFIVTVRFVMRQTGLNAYAEPEVQLQWWVTRIT